MQIEGLYNGKWFPPRGDAGSSHAGSNQVFILSFFVFGLGRLILAALRVLLI